MAQSSPAPSLLLRSEAARNGIGDGDLRRLVAQRQLTRLRLGSYVGAVDFAALDREKQHASHIQAALAAQQSRTIVSFQSAAVLHGFPTWAVNLGVVHLNKERRNAGRSSRLLHVHSGTLDPIDVVQIAGVSVTGPARTVFDLAASIPFEQAVVIADAALFANSTTKDELADVLLRSRGRRGREGASLALQFADGRSESVGESRSRVGIYRAGLQMPILQHRVFHPDGPEAGRSDFNWDWLLGEFDGLKKYQRSLQPGVEPGDVVVREKLREDVLRELGYDVVRWIWQELNDPRRLYARIQTRIASAQRRLGSRI